MLGESREFLRTPEGLPKDNLTLTPVMDMVEEFQSRLKNLAVEVCTCTSFLVYIYMYI